ncbi:uncharacterized protein HKW66_Vig0246740 [Vigna angularis]|uniref:Uncharacterized protein n=1 Tax=Phaseolus angularis TaxID=3914 RepID=A0A8T0KAY0_PHAAN|nr:uncharacterized protein HKW66_Vig0246740 [Vigna angularis]
MELTVRKTPLIGPPHSPHSGETPANLRRHSGTGTEPPGMKRHLQRLPRSLGRNEGNTMSCSRRALDVGAAAPSNGTGWRRSISPTRPSTVNGGTPARTRSLSLSLVNPFSNSLVSLSRSRLSVSNVRAASLSTKFEYHFKFRTHTLNCPCPSLATSHFKQVFSECSSFFTLKRGPLKR